MCGVTETPNNSTRPTESAYAELRSGRVAAVKPRSEGGAQRKEGEEVAWGGEWDVEEVDSGNGYGRMGSGEWEVEVEVEVVVDLEVEVEVEVGALAEEEAEWFRLYQQEWMRCRRARGGG